MSRAVIRAAQILSSVAEKPKIAADLARELDLHRSTMSRELAALEEIGYLRKRSDGSYALGRELIGLSRLALEGIDLRAVGAEPIRSLHRRVGNTVHLAALLGDSIVYVDKVEDPSGVRLHSKIGNAVLPHASGVGKAVLAYVPESERIAILRDVEWEAYTPTTLTSPEALEAELEEIRLRGYATDNGEFESFINCVALPIRSASGVVGAISLTAIKQKLGIAELREYLPDIKRTIALIERELD